MERHLREDTLIGEEFEDLRGFGDILVALCTQMIPVLFRGLLRAIVIAPDVI